MPFLLIRVDFVSEKPFETASDEINCDSLIKFFGTIKFMNIIVSQLLI